MIIQIDSREKAKAITKILKTFDDEKVDYFVSKLYVGDYMNFDNPRLIVDRKQNLSELCSNVCQQHERFRSEIIRANEHGIKIIFLVEHGNGVKKLEDVVWWNNPRSVKRVKDARRHWENVPTKAMQGDTLYKVLSTMQRKYDIQFEFCEKKDTGKRIIELLEGGGNDKRGD